MRLITMNYKESYRNPFSFFFGCSKRYCRHCPEWREGNAVEAGEAGEVAELVEVAIAHLDLTNLNRRDDLKRLERKEKCILQQARL